MIRRGFWLLTGAVLGVTGYRKATRLARTLTGQNVLSGPAGTRQRPAVQRDIVHRDTVQPDPGPAARIAAAAARATAAAGFVRDVRDGMAEYWDLHHSESDRTLGSQRDRIWSGESQQGRR